MRVNKGLDQAQPEWPAAASATGTAPAFETGTGVLGGGAVQRFPETAAVPAARIEDPWERSGPDAAGPGELTVRLDRAEAGAVRPDAARGAGGAAGGSDGPVFVDESGRRSRRFRRIGMAVGLSCGAYAAVIAVTLVSGNSNAPWLPVPGQGGDTPASKVETSPEPSESALPAGAGRGVGAAVPGRPGLPGVSGISAPGTGGATGSAGPSTGAGTPAPTVSAGPGSSGATAGPAATATTTGRARPPAGGVTGPTTAPTPPPASTPADPTPSGGGGPTAPDPSASTGAGGGGSADGGGSGGGGAATNAPGTVADGPSGPVPVTGEPAAGASGSATAPGPATSPGPTGTSAGEAGSGSAAGAQVTTTVRTVA